MSPHQDALEHLRVIRSLMEKAHIYRAISAPAALLGGVLALVCAAYDGWRLAKGGGVVAGSPAAFLLQWYGILLVTGGMNVWLLARDARRRGQFFVSDGMRMALRWLFPPMAAGGVLGTGLVVYLNNHVLAALVWTITYGLALLATASFSPRSLIWLGRVFLVLGLGLFWCWAASPDVRMLPDDAALASLVMGATFGLCHLVYALAVFASGSATQAPAPSAHD